jgi:hypothetical protein
VNWYILPLNPQENTAIPFQNNLNTRILEKDYFLAKAPCVPASKGELLSAKPFSGYGNNINVNNCISNNTCGQI